MRRFIAMLLILILCVGTIVVSADTAEDVIVEAEGKVLEKDVDYTLTYRDNVDPGTATIVISFIGNYAGTMEQTFEIKRAKRAGSGSGGSGGGRIVVTTEEVYDAPYIMGYADGTFRPEADITRAEAATAVARAIGLDMQKNSASAFDDISSHWAKGYINAAANKEIVNGYEDSKFCPDENITRAEFAKIIAKMLGGASQNDKAEFIDTAGHWAEPYIATLTEKGIITGYEDNTYRPDESITRAEAVTIINRAVPRSGISTTVKQFTDVTSNHWAYEEIEKAAGRTDGE